MAKIFYSISGEGCGHAARAKTVIELLRNDHQIVIYAPCMAWDMLGYEYRDTENVEVRKVFGYRFIYNVRGRLSYFRTLMHGIDKLPDFVRLVRRLRRDIETEKPDIGIVDFEPAFSRAASQANLPFISLDHQHFADTYDLSPLPLSLRIKAACIAQMGKAYCRRFHYAIVSSFFFPPLKPCRQNVTQVGVLLRPEILKAVPENRDHLTAYFRKSFPAHLRNMLSTCGREVRIYGLGRRPGEGRLKFFDIDPRRFVEDLATCRALVTTAGNELPGEALYMGKPILAFPEPGDWEQEIHGYFLNQSGGGMSLPMERITPVLLETFLKRFKPEEIRVDRERMNGNIATLEAINGYLNACS